MRLHLAAPATQRLCLKFSRLLIFAFGHALMITTGWIVSRTTRDLSRDCGIQRELSKLVTELVREFCSTCPLRELQELVSTFEFPFRDACLEARNEIRVVEKYLMLARAIMANGHLQITPIPETWRLVNTITDWKDGQA
jgi:hypothetical protein